MRGRAAPVVRASVGALAVLSSALAASVVHAETLYVIEQLVVSVTSEPDSSGERVASIHSGDHVEVLDRQGDEIQVRLENGTEGWIKTSYLSADPPLKVRLSERTAEVDKLKQDVTRLEAELTAARVAARAKPSAVVPNTSPAQRPAAASNAATPAATPADVTSSVATTTAATTSDGEPAADATSHEPSFFMTPPEAPARPIWQWVLGSTVVSLGLGFLLGWHLLDRRIRQKYGGLRIY
jgi:uncharacterized protein YgiM (DUF1202 family)